LQDLPADVIRIIGGMLTHKEKKRLAESGNKHLLTLFRTSIKLANQEIRPSLKLLLIFISRGKQEEAEAIIKNNSGIQCGKKFIKSRSSTSITSGTI
jgi:hypothetical protein